MQNSNWKNQFIKFYATGAYSGLFPIAPGTVGTLFAVLLFYFMPSNIYLYILITLIVIVTGTWASTLAERDIFKTKDSSEIVIDEIAGYFVTMLFFNASDGWLTILIGFVLFRIFDIAKPYPINKLQKLKGGVGIMADDLLAGLISNILLHIIHHYFL